MKIEINESDCSRIVEKIATEISYKLNIQQLQHEIVNKVSNDIKKEIIKSEKTAARIDESFKKVERSINDRVQNKITEKINNFDFQVKLKD